MPRKKTQKATPAVIERLERTAQAIELRKSGATFARIGDHFGVSAQSAHEMVMKGLKATLAEPAAEHRALAVQRLDHMLNAIWPAATNGDLQAQAGVLRLEERRAKLLGLDAPNKQIEDVRDVSDAKATLLAKLRKMAERMRPPEIAAPNQIANSDDACYQKAGPTCGERESDDAGCNFGTALGRALRARGMEPPKNRLKELSCHFQNADEVVR